MTVGDLKRTLSNYDDNTIITIQPNNCKYAESVRYADMKHVNCFRGSDENTLVLIGGEQKGEVKKFTWK